MNFRLQGSGVLCPDSVSLKEPPANSLSASSKPATKSLKGWLSLCAYSIIGEYAMTASDQAHNNGYQVQKPLTAIHT